MALLTDDKHFDQMDQHISDIKDWLEMVEGPSSIWAIDRV